MKKILTTALFSMILVFSVFHFNIPADAGGLPTVADKDFQKARSLYMFCITHEAKSYDVYNFKLGEEYYLKAEKEYRVGKEANFEKARQFSVLAIPHLEQVKKKFLESNQ